jgi:hypothetical protein
VKGIIICVLGTCFNASLNMRWEVWSRTIDDKQAVAPSVYMESTPGELRTGARHTVTRRVSHWPWRYFFRLCMLDARIGCEPKIMEVTELEYDSYSIGESFR